MNIFQEKLLQMLSQTDAKTHGRMGKHEFIQSPLPKTIQLPNSTELASELESGLRDTVD